MLSCDYHDFSTCEAIFDLIGEILGTPVKSVDKQKLEVQTVSPLERHSAGNQNKGEASLK